MSEPIADFVARLRVSRYVPFDAPAVPVSRPPSGENAVFDRALDYLRQFPTWGRMPARTPPTPLVPPPLHSAGFPPLHTGEAAVRVQRALRAGRVYAAQQNAIEGPFKAIARAKWGKGKGDSGTAHGGAAAGRGAAGALGFISIATKDTGLSACGTGRLPREKLKIDREAQRCKRMRNSLSNSARLIHREAHVERSAQRWNLKFLTLTYRDVDGWEPGHWGAFRKALNSWCVRHKVKLRMVWVAELQVRGAVHYHAVIWLPRGKYLPQADTKGWWPHGMTNIQTAQSPIGYLMKYASKTTASSVLGYPRGARIFGVCGLSKSAREEVRYWGAPVWVRDAMPGTADIRKVVGGYVDRHTGEFLSSPWRVWVGPDGQPWAYRIDQPLEMAA